MLTLGSLCLKNPIAFVIPLQAEGDLPKMPGLMMMEVPQLSDIGIGELEAMVDRTTGMLSPGQRMGISIPWIPGYASEVMDMAARKNAMLEIDLRRCGIDSELFNSLKELSDRPPALCVRLSLQDLERLDRHALNLNGFDLIDIDLAGQQRLGPKIIKSRNDVGSPKIMATSVIKQFDDAKDLFTMGASIVCLPASTDPEFADWLAEAMVEYGKIMGWYNAPKHICAGGDLRGLAFCCPPVKNCPIHGALKKLGMTPEEFAKRKQQIARGTILDQEVDTCFGSLIWCCKITKPCYMRDAALRRLRISEAEYMVLKKNVAERLLNKSF